MPACLPACLRACLRACGLACLACLLGLAWPGPGLLAGLAAWLPGCKECTAQKHEAGTPYRCTRVAYGTRLPSL